MVTISPMTEKEMGVTSDSVKELCDNKTKKLVKAAAETYFNEVVVPEHEQSLLRLEHTKKAIDHKSAVSKVTRKEAVKNDLLEFAAGYAIVGSIATVSGIVLGTLCSKIDKFFNSKK